MCIEFSRSNGGYDVVSPFVNIIGNGLVLAAAGAATGLIVALALKALGYSGAAIAIGSALPFAVGLAAVVVAATVAALFLCLLVSAFTNR